MLTLHVHSVSGRPRVQVTARDTSRDVRTTLPKLIKSLIVPFDVCVTSLTLLNRTALAFNHISSN